MIRVLNLRDILINPNSPQNQNYVVGLNHWYENSNDLILNINGQQVFNDRFGSLQVARTLDHDTVIPDFYFQSTNPFPIVNPSIANWREFNFSVPITQPGLYREMITLKNNVAPYNPTYLNSSAAEYYALIKANASFKIGNTVNPSNVNAVINNQLVFDMTISYGGEVSNTWVMRKVIFNGPTATYQPAVLNVDYTVNLVANPNGGLPLQGFTFLVAGYYSFTRVMEGYTSNFNPYNQKNGFYFGSSAEKVNSNTDVRSTLINVTPTPEIIPLIYTYPKVETHFEVLNQSDLISQSPFETYTTRQFRVKAEVLYNTGSAVYNNTNITPSVNEWADIMASDLEYDLIITKENGDPYDIKTNVNLSETLVTIYEPGNYDFIYKTRVK